MHTQNNLAIALRHVKKVYDGGCKPIKIFDDINIEVRRGEFVAVIGPTGCGKTTLINLIAGFDVPQAGNIYVEGVDITKLHEREKTVFRAKNIGVVFQVHNLIPTLTVYENVELPLVLLGVEKNKRRKRVEELLEHMFMGGYANRKVSTLSVGECQLVNLARALISNPKILLMDEPIEYLDPLTTDTLLAFLKGEIFRKKTVLLTTHKRKVAKIAERTLYLRRKIP